MEEILKITPSPCPRCLGTSIGVKDILVATPWRGEARKIWAYCRSCGYKGPETVVNVKISDDDEIREGLSSWNKGRDQLYLQKGAGK